MAYTNHGLNLSSFTCSWYILVCPISNSLIPDHISWCWIVFHLTFPYVWKYYTWLQILLLNSFIPNTPLTFPNVDLNYTWLYMYFQVLCYIWLHFLLLDSVIPESISLLLQKCTSKVIPNYVSWHWIVTNVNSSWCWMVFYLITSPHFWMCYIWLHFP